MSAPVEMWLGGPVPGIAPVFQPAAHALLQARADVEALAPSLGVDVLWARRGSSATAGFHLLHMAGALDRLCTYARGEALTDAHKTTARAEAQDHPEMDGRALASVVSTQIDRALAQLAATDPSTAFDVRLIGRAQLPTTVVGALFHAAEHTARHAGQFVTVVKMLA